MADNGRIPIDAGDFFSGEQRKLGVADRRPGLARAREMFGPGIGSAAVAITDFNTAPATYNGFFSALDGANNAPIGGDDFVGMTVMDSRLGGVQTFTAMSSGRTFRRVFRRNPGDAETIAYDLWSDTSGGSPVGSIVAYGGTTPPQGWLVCNGAAVYTADYPQLYEAIGTNFGGVGNILYLPDLRDRTIYGPGGHWSIGATDGLEVANRTKDLLHRHFYQASGGGHTHNPTSGGPSSSSAGVVSGSSTSVPGPAHSHTISEGSDGRHGHAGETADVDYAGLGPKLRGAGALWIIRAF